MKIAEFEAATALIRDMANGRPVTVNDREIVLEWAQGQPEIPVWVAGYGPRALGVAGRQADGVVIQLADPDIIDWIMGQARAAAEAGGRAPRDLAPIVCAPGPSATTSPRGGTRCDGSPQWSETTSPICSSDMTSRCFRRA